MARIVGHLSVAELEARYRAARDVTEARHFQAIWLLAQGRTVLEVAEVLAFVPRWVTQLAARYNAFGPEGLGADRPAADRPRSSSGSMAARRRLRAADQWRDGLVSLSGLSKPFFAELLAAFARQTGAGRKRHIILVLDNAGWHGPEGLTVPDGISLVFLPPYSPELQPAEHLWPLVDEPVANRHFATLADLEAVVAERCRRLDADAIGPHTDFHWWPKPIRPN